MEPNRRARVGVGAASVTISELQMAIALANNVAQIAGVLSNLHRSRIVALAIKQPGLNVSGVAALLEASVPLISYHVRRLEIAGFVRHERAGRSKIILPDHSYVSEIFLALGETGSLARSRRDSSR